jgi:hypothetical protein
MVIDVAEGVVGGTIAMMTLSNWKEMIRLVVVALLEQ